jgi:hypothetical protein
MSHQASTVMETPYPDLFLPPDNFTLPFFRLGHHAKCPSLQLLADDLDLLRGNKTLLVGITDG